MVFWFIVTSDLSLFASIGLIATAAHAFGVKRAVRVLAHCGALSSLEVALLAPVLGIHLAVSVWTHQEGLDEFGDPFLFA